MNSLLELATPVQHLYSSATFGTHPAALHTTTVPVRPAARNHLSAC